MNILRVKRKCLEVLRRVEEDGAYLHLLLQKEARAVHVSPEEYPVLVQLVRGILENQSTLDATLTALVPSGFSALPHPVRDTLRLGAYQILFLERVKKRDVVFEAVELIKGGSFRGFAGMVNAVLRKIEPQAGMTGGRTAVETYPEWLIARWSRQFGVEEVQLFCQASNENLPLYLRVHTARIGREALQKALAAQGVYTEVAPFSPHSLRVTRLPKNRRLHQIPALRDGLCFIQDLSSTIVADIVSNGLPRTVEDLCAAPGGKSCSIALSIASSNGTVYARDRTEKRVMLIREMCMRLGIENIHCEVVDALDPPYGEPKLFDAVLVDAPCSGFGTVGRKVDVRWSKSEDTLAELVTLQERILMRAALDVKPGGVMVYSTCTIDQAENEGVVTRFLEQETSFAVEDCSSILPKELCTAQGFYRTWPHRHAMAGAFAAKLRKAPISASSSSTVG